MPRFDQLTGDQMAQLAYLVLLGVVLASYVLVAGRGRMGTMLRHAVLWALLFTGVAAAWGLWDSARLTSAVVQQAPDGTGIAVRRSADRQFHLTLDLTGPSGVARPVSFILDTGATDMVLTRADAASLGFGASDLRFLGTARTAEVRLDSVVLQGHAAQNVRALVNEGALHASLLGMRYLERFARIEIARDILRIVF
jgi:aspartyl protease family protein